MRLALFHGATLPLHSARHASDLGASYKLRALVPSTLPSGKPVHRFEFK